MNDPRLQALHDQVDLLLLWLERPVVQNQMIAFMAIVLISWLLPEPLAALFKRLLDQQEANTELREKLGLPTNIWYTRLLRWLRGLQLLLFPIVGLIASQLTISYFESRNWPLGLLQHLALIFWLVLAYQIVNALLFGSLPSDRAHTYRRNLTTPIFVILIAIIISAGMVGSFPILNIALFRFADTPLTLTNVATALLVIYATLAASWLINEVLGNFVLPHTATNTGMRNTVLIISRYAVIGIGGLLAISIMGVNLSAFAIIGGGLSVGIGFGLQDLVANFISGILLLFEQTLRPGDIIEVGGKRGRVDEMRMRSALLRTDDNIEIYVPNKTLLTSTVSDFSNVNHTIRKTLEIGVSYKSDPIHVRDTLQEVVESHGLVAKDRAPEVFFTHFGAYTLDFEVAFWIDDPNRAAQVLSDLHFMIFREFAKRGIGIPIPRQGSQVQGQPDAYVEAFWPPAVEESALAETNTSLSTEVRLEGGPEFPPPNSGATSPVG